PEEGSLTADGRVLGTYRAMSPEQARGETVDFRSDLFSLGVLLYEALTGQSPFEAENELAMLSRIVHSRQIPVRKVRPEVPAELSDLVDQLLEKDPLARPRSAREVANSLSISATPDLHDNTPTVADPLPLRSSVTGEPLSVRQLTNSDSALAVAGVRKRITAVLLILFLLAILGVVAYMSLRTPTSPLYVAVLVPEIAKTSAATDAALLVSGVRSALVRGLVSLEAVSPKATDEVAGASGSPVQVARAVAADEVVASRLDCSPESCRITLDRIRGRDGALLWSESFEVPADDPYLATRATATHLLRGYPDRSVRKGAPTMDVSSKDFSEYLRLRQRFESRKEPSLDPILDGLAAIRGRSPKFLDAYLTEADVARYKFSATRHAEDLERGLDLSRRARELAPG
ncbi:MAG: serine/threonine protein kinase, partial [bacterium]